MAKTCVGCNRTKDIDSFERQGLKGRRAKCKDCRSSQHLANLRFTKYGLTVESYQRMLEEQDFACAVCGEKEGAKAPHAPRVRALSVDHNHETGEVRALLCGNCNTAVGLMKEDPTRLEAAANYLRGFA